MKFFYFLRQKKFYVHLLIALLLTLLIIWGVLQSLAWYTRHGEVYLVPDFSGQTIQELQNRNYGDYFDLQIIDSVYDKNKIAGEVVMQNPLPNSKVKKGRNVYLTIVAKMPEMVEMPNLRNLSLRQALVLLEEKGLPVKNLNYIEYFAKNAVVEQLLVNEPIEAGTKIPKGTYITIVVGKGNDHELVPLPFVLGNKIQQVHKALHYASLNIGNEYFIDGYDTSHTRVFKTEPSYFDKDRLNPGDSVNIWYRSDENFDFKTYIQQLRDTTLMDSTRIDSIRINSDKLKTADSAQNTGF